MKKAMIMTLAAIGWLALAAGPAAAADSACITCHEKVTPGIVADWKKSAMAGEFDCTKCHGDQHKDASDAAKAAMPTPEICKACHKQQYDQYMAGKHSKGWIAMAAMPTNSLQPHAVHRGAQGVRRLPPRRHQARRGEEVQPLRDGLQLLPHPARLLEGRGAEAAGLHDLPHGLRPPAVGDVVDLEARRDRPLDRRPRSRAGLPDLPHARRRPRREDRVGLSRGAPARGRRGVDGLPRVDPQGASGARRRRQADRPPRGREGRGRGAADEGGLRRRAQQDGRRSARSATARRS